MPGAGHTLAAAVYRPLAEQLAGVAAIGARERVLELSAGDGELTAHLHRTLGAAALTVVVADSQQPWRLPFGDSAFDLALSLLAIAADDQLTATLTELARVAQRARVVVWTDGATHENALRDAMATTATITAPAPPLLAGWTHTTLNDVARFDGIGQLWLALVTERGIEVPVGEEHAMRERLQRNVAPYTAADGTMRMPVRAALLSLH